MYSKKAILAFILATSPFLAGIIAFIGAIIAQGNVDTIGITFIIFAYSYPILFIVGLILAIRALIDINKNNELKGKGLAITSIVLFSIEVIWLLFVIWSLSWWN